MATIFPNGLDTFPNPSGSISLDGGGNSALKHSVQHKNVNDALEAIQSHIGITGSNVSGTINFRLDNVESGHDHDGTNSRPAKLGSGSYTDGLFNFSATTSVGEAVSKLNSSAKSFDTALSASVSSSVSNSFDTRQILLLAEQGPFEGFFGQFPLYKEIVYTNASAYLVSASVWYTDITKQKKIFEIEYFSRNARSQAEQINYRVFHEDGINIKRKITDIITYNGARELSRIRTVT